MTLKEIQESRINSKMPSCGVCLPLRIQVKTKRGCFEESVLRVSTAVSILCKQRPYSVSPRELSNPHDF